MTACLPPCSDMTSTDEALHCVALRAGLCQIQTGPTCMQLADRTCPQQVITISFTAEELEKDPAVGAIPKLSFC